MNKRGFTLIELLVVIMLLSIIGIIATSTLSNTKEKADMLINKGNINIIMRNASMYASDNKTEVELSTIEKLIDGISTNVIKTNVLSLKENNNLSVEESLNNLQVYMYIKNNRTYACIDKNENYDILLSYFGKEENFSYIENYFCN